MQKFSVVQNWEFLESRTSVSGRCVTVLKSESRHCSDNAKSNSALSHIDRRGSWVGLANKYFSGHIVKKSLKLRTRAFSISSRVYILYTVESCSKIYMKNSALPWVIGKKRVLLFFKHLCVAYVINFNPNKSGIGGKPPTFVQNDFTPWCLKLNIFF